MLLPLVPQRAGQRQPVRHLRILDAIDEPQSVSLSIRSFLLHDPLLIGGVAAAVLAGTSVLLGVPVDGPLLGAGFCGTALVYGADRRVGRSPEDLVNRPERVTWVRRHRGWLRGEAIGLAVGLALLIPLLQRQTLWAAAVPAALALLHLAPVLPGARRLKAIGSAKSLLVALGWAFGATLLPVMEATGPVPSLPAIAWTGAYRFVLVLPNIVLADWGDREGDRRAGLQTWTTPWQRVDVQRGLSILLVAGFMGVGLAVVSFGAPEILLLDACVLVIMLLAVWRLRPGEEPLHALLLDLVVAWPVVNLITLLG